MDDEIKEILDDLDYCKNRKRGNISLKHNECDLLLDYITNLQKQLDEYQKALDETMSEKIDLQQENERLKERCDYLQRSCDRKEEQRDYARMEYMQQEDYKSRIDKAIEYIEDTYMFDYENDDRLELKDQWYAKDILNILKGDSNE